MLTINFVKNATATTTTISILPPGYASPVKLRLPVAVDGTADSKGDDGKVKPGLFTVLRTIGKGKVILSLPKVSETTENGTEYSFGQRTSWTGEELANLLDPAPVVLPLGKGKGKGKKDETETAPPIGSAAGN